MKNANNFSPAFLNNFYKLVEVNQESDVASWFARNIVGIFANLLQNVVVNNLPFPILCTLMTFVHNYKRTERTAEFKTMKTIMEFDYSNAIPCKGDKDMPKNIYNSLFGLMKYNNGKFKSDKQKDLFLSFSGITKKDIVEGRFGTVLASNFIYLFVYDNDGIMLCVKRSIITKVSEIYFLRSEETEKKSVNANKFKQLNNEIKAEVERLKPIFDSYTERLIQSKYGNKIDFSIFLNRYSMAFISMDENKELSFSLENINQNIAECEAVKDRHAEELIHNLSLAKEFLIQEGLCFDAERPNKFYKFIGEIDWESKVPVYHTWEHKF